jgi:hypothetical protein
MFAVTALHNFIRRNNRISEMSDWEETEDERVARLEAERVGRRGATDVPDIEAVEGEDPQMAELRETIALRMWSDYVVHRERARNSRR